MKENKDKTEINRKDFKKLYINLGKQDPTEQKNLLDKLKKSLNIGSIQGIYKKLEKPEANSQVEEQFIERECRKAFKKLNLTT